MPDIWTHILFADEVLAELGGKDIPEVNWAKARPALYRFSSQGPDFFFYYQFWPWQKTNGVDDIGRHIQNKVGGQFVRTGVRYLKALQSQGVGAFAHKSFPQPVDKSGDNHVDSSGYLSLVVYMTGFICHYALDAATHPFVHYKSGIYRKHDPHSHQYYGNHKILEGTIDAILLKEKRNLQSVKTPAGPWIDCGERLPDALLAFYQDQVGKLLNQSVDHDAVNTAYRDMIKALDIFYDPARVKAGFVKTVRLLTGGKVDFVHFFIPHHVDNTVDYLNRRRLQWLHPADDKEVHYESFDDLWNLAKGWSKLWIQAMLDYLHDRITAAELDARIPNLSFSSGRKLGEGDEEVMRFFKPLIGLK